MLHAERLAKILVDVEIARILLRQGEAHEDRAIYARRYLTRMLPRVTALAMEIQAGADLDDLMGRVDDEGGSEGKVA